MRNFKNIIKTACELLIGFDKERCQDDREIWIFGEWHGSGKYFDNSKHLFEYAVKSHPEVRAVWLSKNIQTVKKVREEGYESYLSYSLKGYWIAFRSKVGVVCHRPRTDLNLFSLLNGSKLILLWHGIPLKKIGFDDKNFPLNRGFFRPLFYFLKTKILENYAMITVTSKENGRTFGSAFLISEDRIKITGFPRNDGLFLSTPKGIGGNNLKGIYMPTFRGKLDAKIELFEKYGFDFDQINNFLKERDIALYLRLHPLQVIPKEILEQIEAGTNHIHFFQEENIYSYLNQFDFLITDYSSIYFDYLLLDRPIIFSSFDLEEYQSNDREFYYAYNEVTPGPKAKNWDELLQCIEESSRDPEKFREERERVRNLFHKYKDGHSCERVFREIRRTMENKTKREK